MTTKMRALERLAIDIRNLGKRQFVCEDCKRPTPVLHHWGSFEFARWMLCRDCLNERNSPTLIVKR